ncbi:reverse transcriptase domain-containing protein [Tanacetum coccineum]
MEFAIVKSHSPYNVILGRTGLRSLGVVASTIHSMIKFPTANGIATMTTKREILQECQRMEEARGPAMKGRITIPRIQVLESEGTTNKGRGKAEDRQTKWGNLTASYNRRPSRLRKALQQMKKIRERTSPLSRLKINLPRRSGLIEILHKHADAFAWTSANMTGILCFIAEHELKTYLNIESRVQRKRSIAPDRRKVVKDEVAEWLKAGIFRKNVGATYQRLVDTIFEGQMGRNLEAYVDDTVIKSMTELEMIKDVKETMLTLKKAMKKLIAELPTLTAPKKEQELMVYLSAANEAVSAMIENVLLRPYNQGYHRQANKSYIKQSGSNGKIGQVGSRARSLWHQIPPKSMIKGQVLADFLVDTMTKDNPTQEDTNGPGDTLEEGEGREEQETTTTKAPKNLKAEAEVWKLYTDGASNKHGSRAALLAGLRITTKMKVEKMHAFVDSKLVANQVEGSEENRKADVLIKLAAVQCEGLTKGVLIEELNERSVDMAEVNAIIEEATRTWMTPIQEYIEHGILPDDVAEARTIREKARNYTIQEGVLYRKFGIPATIITDNETQLINDPSKSWAEGLGIKLVSTSVYHPQANGAVERANQSIMQGIKTRLHQEEGAWVEELPNVLWAYRTTPKTSNGETPFSLAYGTKAVIPAKIGIPTRRTIQGPDEENEEALRMNFNLLEERREIAEIREARRKQQVEKYYNQ